MIQRLRENRIVKFLYEHALLFVILIIGFVIWATLFDLAVTDYMNSELWRTRGVWLGTGTYDLYGYTVSYQLEGYTDYSFYYVHWGNNMLRGVMPYDPDFGSIVLNGYANENGAYMFPPFSAYLYAAGIALPVDDWGIGLLIVIFGYLTALPVYGLGKELSGNRHVGEAAALTYFLNPNVLYHTVFAWTNPAPFIFFFFSGFYMLTKGRKHTGTILIVCAAMFKQTAWFLGIPLVVYLLVRPKQIEVKEKTDTEQKEPRKSILQELLEYVNLPEFGTSVILVLSFALAVMLPFILATPEFLRNLSLAAGGFPLESFTELPGYGSPMRLQVLPVAAGFPELAQIMDLIVYFGILLTFSAVLIMGLMFLMERDRDRPVYYMRRLLFMTMILMLCVHLLGPRGVYKYYFTLFTPFFSIFASTKMVTSEDEKVPFSFSMLWLPILLSLAIILPSRTIYLFCVILILLGYLLAPQIGAFWNLLNSPGRWFMKSLRRKLEPITSRFNNMRESRGQRISGDAEEITH
ncbi:MAG: hypothetical protein ACW98Y_11715 [Candidatus Thorarchaeota archaeon]|jgi:hypothetical protein